MCSCAGAQVPALPEAAEDAPNARLAGRPYAFVSPLKIVDFTHPGYLFGGGYWLTNRLSVEVGYLHLLRQRLLIGNRGGLPIDGHRWHLTARWVYSGTPEAAHTAIPYLGLRIDRLRKSYGDYDDYTVWTADTSTLSISDTFSLDQRNLTINALFGVELKVTDHLHFDVVAGVGLRHVRRRYANGYEPDPRPRLLPFYEWGGPREPHEPFSGWRLNLVLDCRLVYRF